MTCAVELEAVAGVQQELTVIFPVRLIAQPGWSEGPLPFELGNQRTDARVRSTYFAPSSARVLYGATGRPCRWHRFTTVEYGALRLRGIELLSTATIRHPQHALAVLHFTTDAPLLPLLRAVSHRSTAEHDPLTGPLAPDRLLAGLAEVRDNPDTYSITRPYTVAFLTPGTSHNQALRTGSEAQLPATADHWLWQLASRSTPVDFPLAPETAVDELSRAVRLSADWSALVLRNGAAFLGHRPDSGAGDFYEHAALHARTVYLDALLLGSVQRDHIDELTDELSAVFDQPRLAARVSALEKNLAHFRSTYWRQHLTAHGPANDLLLAFQKQYQLPARFDEILAETADYSRLVQTQESQQISGALGVITILGLPLGTALGILQTLDDNSKIHLLIALALSIAATAAALATRYGRLVLSSLRGGNGPRPPS